MRHFRLVAFALFLLGFSLPLLAQHGAKSSGNPPATPSSIESSGNTNEAAGGHREPCWKVAGIAPATLQQRRSIEQNAKAEIAAACADSSLTPQQRHQKIQQIHQQTMQSVEALFTPQQQAALKACRQAREEAAQSASQSHPQNTSTEAPHPQGGPCGETTEPASTSNNAASSHRFN